MPLTALLCASLYVVDGDTIRCDDESIRLLGPGAPYRGGYDAPETHRPDCEYERRLGYEAKARLLEMVRQDGVQIVSSGQRDRYGRILGWVVLPDGSTAGERLIAEGLAQHWPGNPGWCG